MKIKVSHKRFERGNALIGTLIICSILSMVMAYYLSLIEQQNKLSFRSQAWNSAISITEAGIEEGMAQVNQNPGNLATDGWSPSGAVYTKTRPFANGDSYTATITPNPGNIYTPFDVTSVATVNPAGGGLLAAIGLGGATTTPVARAVLVHTTRGNLLIKGMVARHSINMNGNGITTDSFDSSDPAYNIMGRYPTGDSSKLRANGDIAVNDSVTNAISGGNANIYGHVTTGPTGTISVGNNGGVGDQAWVAANPGQIEPGYTANNANFTFPETQLPYTTGLSASNNMTVVVTNYIFSTNSMVFTNTVPNPIPYGGVVTNTTYVTSSIKPNPVPANLVTNCGNALTGPNAGFPAAGTYCGTPFKNNSGQGGGNGSDQWYYYPLNGYTWPTYMYSYSLLSTNFTVSTNTYDHILYSGDYVIDTLSGKTLVMGNARLVVLNGINMSGNDTLQIAQTGSLLMYVDGASSTIGGNGIVNQNGYAINCQIYFTPNTTSLTFNGNGETIATIVAPNADVRMNGGGHSDNDMIGAIMGASITLNGHYRFHYDEALNKGPKMGRYIVSSWDEIKPH